MNRTLLTAVILALLAGDASAQASARTRITLSEAVSRATSSTPTVEIASLQVEEANARVAQARSDLLPSVRANAGWVNRTMNIHSFGLEFPSIPGQPPFPDKIGPFDTYDARVMAVQPLLDLSAWQRVRESRSAVAATTAERTTIIEASAQRAAFAYLQGARASATLVARQADAALAAELLTLAQAQEQAGVGTAIDVIRARTQKVAADGLVLVARNQLRQASVDLARILGLDPATEFEFADTLGTAFAASEAPASLEDATRMALQRRPELKAGRARGETARMAVRSLRLERLPRLEVAADFGANGPEVGNTIGTGQVGLQISIPLFDGLGREARIEEQEARVREADVHAHDLAQQVTSDVRAALLSLESGTEQEQIAQERLSLAEEELSQARERFRNGVAGNIEIINAQSSLLRAKDADIDARFAVAAARIALAHASGVAATIR